MNYAYNIQDDKHNFRHKEELKLPTSYQMKSSQHVPTWSNYGSDCLYTPIWTLL